MTHPRRPDPARPSSPVSRHQRREKRKTPPRPSAPIPLAVWITEPDQHDTAPLSEAPGVSHTVLHRTITEFSHSGDDVVLAGSEHAFLARIAESVLGRTITPATLPATTHSETDAGAQAVTQGHTVTTPRGTA